jgi:hypothetical protein
MLYVTVHNKITFFSHSRSKKTFFYAKMSKATSSISSEHETEVISVTIPMPSPHNITSSLPDITSSPPDTTFSPPDTTSSPPNTTSSSDTQIDTIQEEESYININKERKNSWVWSFYRQEQISDGIYTICEVETDIGVKCNKKYKTKGSTGNLINHLLKHGITKDNPQLQKVYKIIIINYS